MVFFREIFSTSPKENSVTMSEFSTVYDLLLLVGKAQVKQTRRHVLVLSRTALKQTFSRQISYGMISNLEGVN